VIVCYDCIKTY
jgi:hypothetical protein